MNKQEEQVIALAGVFQSCMLVDQIAKTAQADVAQLETATNSLLITDPPSTLDVYGGSIGNLRTGLTMLQGLLGRQTPETQMNPIRYAMAVLHLEAKLNKNPGMLNTIGQRLEQAKAQAEHFGPVHENVFEGLASIYMDTISTFRLRIQVSGNPNLLQNSLNAAKIRTMLFSAIRSAVLWRQLGGRRWHFIFKKQSLSKSAQQLLQSA